MDHSYTNFGIYFTARDVFRPNFWLSMESGPGVIRRFQGMTNIPFFQIGTFEFEGYSFYYYCLVIVLVFFLV
ncbi:MAG: hypothetical protein Ct9H300mP29_8200 [Candidatus Neomarinimicrobiota bacterium]|nr:MAG: hypothetical protein Ct9H300mP29_8200 [Candidatus Neomarinimicrobiota bacterium]